MVSQLIDRIQGSAQTVGIQTVTIATYTLPSSVAVMCTAKVVGKDTTTFDGVIAQVMGAANKAAGGAALVGTVQNLVTAQISAALSGAVVTMDVSGNDVRVRATGVLNKTVDWYANLEIMIN